MSKLVKDLVTNELRARYGTLVSALWVELIGCDGITTSGFRRDLHARNMRLEIVKNSLFRRAVVGAPLEKLGRALYGPAALVTGGESVIDAAKVVEQWMPKIAGLKLRGAVLEGEYLDQRAVVGLSKMPTKRDLQARVAGLVRSPGAKLAAAILAPASNVASCLKTIIDRREKGAVAEAA